MNDDWTSSIIERSFELKNTGKSLRVADFNPNTTTLYRGGNEPFDWDKEITIFEARGPTWFSNQSTAELYGPARKFNLTRKITLLNMNDCSTINFIKDLFEKNDDKKSLEALNTTFQIREQGNNDWSCKCVTRLTEDEEDHILGNALCKYFEKNELNIDGWYHLRMSQGSCDGSGTVAPEIMICEPEKTIVYGDRVQYNSTRLIELRGLDKKSKPKTKTISRLNPESSFGSMRKLAF